MLLKVYSVYDAMADAYMQPFFCPARGLAIRSFTEAVNREDHDFHKYSGDFTLFEIAEFDDEKGVFRPYDAFHRIGSGNEFLNSVVSGGEPPLLKALEG